jgi:hypothetical protein
MIRDAKSFPDLSRTEHVRPHILLVEESAPGAWDSIPDAGLCTYDITGTISDQI